MTGQNWPTKQADMQAAVEILQKHGGEGQLTSLMSPQSHMQANGMQFSPSPWLAELTRNLVSRHGEKKGFDILRLVLRELGVFKRENV